MGIAVRSSQMDKPPRGLKGTHAPSGNPALGLLAALGTCILAVSAVKHAHNAMRACAAVFHTCSTHVPPMFHTCSTVFCTMFHSYRVYEVDPTPLNPLPQRIVEHATSCSGIRVEHVWSMGGA